MVCGDRPLGMAFELSCVRLVPGEASPGDEVCSLHGLHGEVVRPGLAEPLRQAHTLVYSGTRIGTPASMARICLTSATPSMPGM